ncbi:MAG: hypothetical protein F4114_01045 [Rhodospirillaceae bacterium]|nr:hypothetical protein [Rhodospirillaceae bacterium]MYB14194.1 hypothetical protein [Rhodospirillaceae bacterium]MYI47654.1 hypothetical protein [Rhodospirillaceae bacterium]
MDVANFGPPGDDAEAGFVTEFDAIPGFWGYLASLDRKDLIAELVQNDLDQDATRTIISFEQDRLICEGNGKPVDPDGWKRLRSILGAGDKVPEKRSKIGVKNHGLKTAFTIGDEIRLLSAGRTIVQTLYARGREEAPYPGASEQPRDDPQAPAEGCRIVVRYRDTDVEPRQGEAIKLGAVDEEKIGELFESACERLPEQFAGIVSPEGASRYEIVLRHWRLGEARFLFSCARPRKIAKRIEVFRRRCAVSGTASQLPEPLQEQAARRLVSLTGRLKERIADFFRHGNRFYVEVSWPISGRGRPKIGTGMFRYPIGYPHDSREARTGHSVYFNAPFASDNKRHGPIRDEATFNELYAACESLLIDVLAHDVIRKWGADGLHPLVPSPDADGGDDVVRPLLAQLAKRDKFPVLNWRDAAELALKGRKKVKQAAAQRLARRRGSNEVKRYRFVVPAVTWSHGTITPALALLCPTSEKQLDPYAHPDIIRLLADCETSGFAEDFVTFDENDVFDRVTGEGNKYFAKIADPGREFSSPMIARAYLDLINLALDNGKWEKDKEEEMFEALSIPDDRAQPVPLRKLWSSALLPTDVPGLNLPPILHSDLVTHPLFRRKKWKRDKFTMVKFLKSSALQDADEDTRRRFWQWLYQNAKLIRPAARPKLADLAIWPDENGRLCRMPDLCEPRSRRVGTILADSIRRPHEQVYRSRLVPSRGNSRTPIRRVPTKNEISDWLDEQLAKIEIGSEPDSTTIDALGRFEADLALLLKDRAIASLLKAIGTTLPALARDGTIQKRTDIVAPSPSVDLLTLPGRFLLKDTKNAAALDKLSPVLREATAAMLLDAFTEDSGNFIALHPRLKHFLSVAQDGTDERQRLAETPILPVDGRPRAPSELALPGNRGDYWGGWKETVPAKDLSQDDQRRYLAAGVTSARPNQKTSRAFFEWLSSRNRADLDSHIPCILRHILHPEGPIKWAETFTETPFIPVRGRNGLQIVSLQTARSRPVYLSDAGDIGDSIIERDSSVLLVVDREKRVAEPISEPLRRFGIKSLREAMNEPENVVGTGNIVRAERGVIDGFDALHSRKFRATFFKRLNELDVDPKLVRGNWQYRLDKIEQFFFANKITARYRFRRKPYLLEVDAGFDAESGIFWVRQDSSIDLSNIYEQIAKQLIFRPEARRIDLLALERAIKLEVDDPSFGYPVDGRPDRNGNSFITEGADGDGPRENEGGDVETDLVEASIGHSPFTPDPRDNLPKPGPIPSEPQTHPRPPRHPNAVSGSDETDDVGQAPELEKDQIDDLKRNQYASHCQICLCERPPQELAPAGSYIESAEVRRHIIEAHHVDPKSGGGARHAGNILVLCKFHHHNFGRRFTRISVIEALQGETNRRNVIFGRTGRETLEIYGRQIKLELSDTHETVEIFFTEQHANYWLSQAGPVGRPARPKAA